MGSGGGGRREIRPAWGRVLLLLVGFTQPACGLFFQTVVGWREEVVTETDRPRSLLVETDPEGAYVSRVEANGRRVPVGRAPLQTEYLERIEEHRLEPRMGAMLVGVGVDVALAAGWGVFCKVAEDGLCNGTLMAGTPLAVMTLLGEAVFLLLAYRRSPVVTQRALPQPATTFVAQLGSRRSQPLSVQGSALRRITLPLEPGPDGVAPPRTLSPIALLVKGPAGGSMTIGIWLTGVEEGARRAVLAAGQRLAEPSTPEQPLSLELALETSGQRCWLRGHLGSHTDLETAAGPCDTDALARQSEALVAALLADPE